MDYSLVFFLMAGAAAFLVGASKGGLPMVGALGVPLLALVMSPVAAAALLLPVYIVSDWVGLWAYRHEYSKRNLGILLPAMIFGVGVGWATAKITPEWMVTLLVGVVDPEDELPAVVAGEEPVEESRPHAADVKVTGGAGGEAGTDAHGGRTGGRGRGRGIAETASR